MTREEARERMKVIKEDCYIIDNPEDKEAFDMAIQALSQEPCDAISRESVDRILRDMGVHCAYDMPSFWANKGKDYKVIPTKWHKGYQQAVADFDKRIRELPSVTQKSGKWISVSERLPEDKTYVLTTIKVPNRIAHARSGWYEGGFFHNDNGDTWNSTDREVVAWMPLPNPCGAKMVEPQESETWNGIHGQITAPKGTFKKIWEDAESEE